MKLIEESQLLDIAFRRAVLKEINGQENITRKKESLKRYEIYKDKTSKYVIEGLKAEGLLPETIEQMSNRVSNISILKKVVNKLARTYSGGVSRETGNDVSNAQISEMARLLSFDEKMKKGDRYRELQRNMLFQIVPEGVESGEAKEMYKLVMRTLLPWHYDVIEDYRDREIPRAVVLSDFSDQNSIMRTAVNSYEAGVHRSSLRSVSSDGVDNIIADNPRDAGQGCEKRFVWWSDSYHFVTNEKAEIIPDVGNPENVNPIEMLPFVNNADEQDGQYWAEGGDDLVDGAILINKQITDMNFIAYMQGYGQWVVTGKNIKDRFVIGPNNASIMEWDPEKGDPEPKVTVVSANPPLGEWMSMIEQYTALFLTTNNLSPGNVSMKLDANTFPSGIALMIEKSEATDDIADKQKSYKDEERQIWKRVAAWQNLLMGTQQLVDEFANVGKIPDDLSVAITFHELKPVISEKEKLDALKARKDLGLDTEVSLLMQDKPDLTKEEATKMLLEIKKEKMENLAMAMTHATAMGDAAAQGKGAPTPVIPGKPGQGNANQVQDGKQNAAVPQKAGNSGSKPVSGK